MHVIATAGHVDHGKSTLVRALTGMEPDRWAEERRRGMTIGLGYAWTTLPSGDRIALVDVPGHERFVTTMLAGVGPVPAVMFVVAADEGWMPQSAEHLAAIDALGVRHGLLVVTRVDLADPAAARDEAAAEIARTGLGRVETVTVSGATGEGLPALRDALDRLVARLPAADATAPVRVWVDRAFTIKGSGTVVTGTLPAGTLRVGDELRLDGRPVRVRALQTLKETTETVSAVARVAINLRGVDRDQVARGMALTSDEWAVTDLVDVRVHGAETSALPREPVLHIGSAAVPVRLRPLGEDTARLTLTRPLPLHIGDRALLRDPGARRVAGVTVLDVRPPALRRRGAAADRARELASGVPDAGALLRRYGLVRIPDLQAMGVAAEAEPVAGDWLADPEHWAGLRRRLVEEVERHDAADPLDPGLPVEAARALLGLPDRRLVDALARPPLRLDGGRVRGPAEASLPAPVAGAVRRLRGDLEKEPFHAPEAGRLAELGLTGRALAAAVRAGALLRIADGIVLLPGADTDAARLLAGLPQPFTVSEARRALGTSRRVAVPLLEHLDRRGITERTGDRRRVR
ncbi:selenocysteine-specific translation elongation factor [Actinoallomurus rhizosphaericola]|uniref:selenocysteine-specific translation elongation factor n=1 Tax=Actinoallomurus rhizosphaericola TaxID=2952536 RepID=UPI00209317A8|nr:selenocysteine-specific translation elongation factor [Actinoallomurus rhizosphaericola]MCO5997170.1 selenocysteine-specific translation elongation factor [Actinoallomurus rhizosphaericola]